MTDSTALLPIVMGVGLTTLTAGDFSPGGRRRASDASMPSFVLAVRLVGFALVGAALYIVGWSVERGGRLGPGDTAAENRLIVALALLIVIVSVRSAWSEMLGAAEKPGWRKASMIGGRALLRLPAGAVTVVMLIGCMLDLFVMSLTSMPFVWLLCAITVMVAVALVLAARLLRRLGGSAQAGELCLSRETANSLLKHLSNVRGEWLFVRITPIGAHHGLEPMRAMVWSTGQAWHWRQEDAYALARYHSWAASNLRVPVPALHGRRLSVYCAWPVSMRGLRSVEYTASIRWWINAFKAHRDLPYAGDQGSAEHKAGLIRIELTELSEAGLVAMAERALEIRGSEGQGGSLSGGGEEERVLAPIEGV